MVVGGIRVCEGLAWDLGGPGIGAGLVFPSSNALRAGVHYECDFFFLSCLQLLHENRLGGQQSSKETYGEAAVDACARGCWLRERRLPW